MDPHYQNLTINNSFATQIYNALVLQDVNPNLIPGLATSWKPVDDRTWEFTLRKNVKFHNGASFSADDVIASMERAANVPNSPSSFATFTKGKKFKNMDLIENRYLVLPLHPKVSIQSAKYICKLINRYTK